MLKSPLLSKVSSTFTRLKSRPETAIAEAVPEPVQDRPKTASAAKAPGLMSKLTAVIGQKVSRQNPDTSEAVIEAVMAEVPDPARHVPAQEFEEDGDDLETLQSVVSQVSVKPMPVDEDVVLDAIEDADLVALANALVGCDVNAPRGCHGVTPLVHALTIDPVSMPVILLLLDAGAETDAPTPLGGTALTAMAMGTFEGWTSTEVLELARAFVALGAGIDHADDGKLSPLHRAILCQNAPVLEALLRLGADADAMVDADASPEVLQGLSPLHMAVMDPDLVALLLTYGANVHARDAFGEDPVSYARGMAKDGAEPSEAAGLERVLHLFKAGQAA